MPGAEDEVPPAINAEVPVEEPTDLIPWEEEQIRGVLSVQGRVVHGLVGKTDRDWLHTEADLGAIAPPLTRICNRYEPVRRMAGHADPILLVTAVGAYVARSMGELRAAQAALEAAGGTVPITPADEIPTPETTAPPPPRVAAAVSPTTPAAVQVPPVDIQDPPPAPPPRPGEAPVDPQAVQWATRTD